MSITVNLLSFTKRENSTKVPTAAQLAAGASFSCTLLDNTTLFNPTFKLSIASNPIGYNYCYVADFGNRYYFITDISTAQGFWYVSCTCDVLASFKDQILSGSHYVVRSASNYDEYILDTAYVSKVNQTITQVTGHVTGESADVSDPFAWSNGHKSYILGIVGTADPLAPSGYQIGSTVFYWLNQDEICAFINFLMLNVDTWSGMDVNTYPVAFQAALLNPVQYVVSAMCFPFSKPSSAGDTHIRFGYYDYPIGGSIHKLSHTNMIFQQTVEINIPKHPQATTRGKFMNGEPYTSYDFYLGPFGTIPLDPAALIDETKITVMVRTDLCTGACKIAIAAGTDTTKILYTGTAQVGISINISQALRDMLGEQVNLATGIVNTVSNALSANVGGAINAEISALADGARLKYPSVMGGGTAGTFLNVHAGGCYLYGKFYNIVNENITEIGRPLCQTKTLSTLSGYCLCDKADAQITGTAEEAIRINTFLNGGFFIE